MSRRRLDYLDMFRGFALLTMVFWHVFNALSRASIYTDPPFYISAFSMPTPFPPPLPFLFVSGMGVYLLTRKWAQAGEKNAFRKIVSRYGKYVLISLPFTAIFFGLDKYIRWEEALQGIGLTAIVAALAMLRLKPRARELIGLILISAVVEALLLKSGGPATANPASLVYNAFIGGWFSVSNLLPMMFGGALMLRLLETKKLTETLIVGLAFTSAALVLHVAGLQISYYGRSFSFALFSVGLPMLVLLALYALYEKVGLRFLGFMNVLGRESLLVYMGHFAFIVRPIEWFWHPALPVGTAILLALPLVGLVYVGAYSYAKWKDGKAVPVEKERFAV